MRKALIVFIGIAVTILLVFSPITSQAITVSFSPGSQDVDLGSSVGVDLDISGLVSGGSPSLGGFDLFISFDPGILSLMNVSFDVDNQLGIVLTEVKNYSSGIEQIYELSFEASADLISNQADSFTLAALTFDTLASGISSLNIVDPNPPTDVSTLSDETGYYALSFSRTSGSVNVGGVSPVPEPATLLLIASALPGLAGMEYYFRRKRSTKTRRVS